jgi:hypothetical protein
VAPAHSCLAAASLAYSCEELGVKEPRSFGGGHARMALVAQAQPFYPPAIHLSSGPLAHIAALALCIARRPRGPRYGVLFRSLAP